MLVAWTGYIGDVSVDGIMGLYVFRNSQRIGENY